MKTPRDPRHIKRQEIVKALFAAGFIEQEEKNITALEILKNKDDINGKIAKIAPEYPIEKINKVDLAILQLGVYELTKHEAPEKVIIDEAIELAKEFGNDSSASFVNGALGKFVKEQNDTNI